MSSSGAITESSVLLVELVSGIVGPVGFVGKTGGVPKYSASLAVWLVVCPLHCCLRTMYVT